MPVNKEEAIAIAKAECKKRGWPWIEPIKVIKETDRWIIKTGLRTKGWSRKTFVIDGKTGLVIRAVSQKR